MWVERWSRAPAPPGPPRPRGRGRGAATMLSTYGRDAGEDGRGPNDTRRSVKMGRRDGDPCNPRRHLGERFTRGRYRLYQQFLV
jgi:hypothetical protein